MTTAAPVPARAEETYDQWYYATHRERRRAQIAAYDAKHREERRVYDKARYAAQRNAITKRASARYRANRTAILARVMRYYRTHPEKITELRNRRRARLHGAVAEPINYRRILLDSKGLCGICRKPLDLFGIHFDHIIPLARGGSHTNANIQVAHARCNIQKGARLHR